MDTNVKKKAVNPYHGSTDYTDIKVSDWVTYWQENKTFFHKSEPQEMLVKHLDKLVNGRSAITVFFPFCGKSVDMKLLYDAGHTVVGVDVAEQALRQFFTENKIDYTVEKLNKINGSLYRSSDGRIRLYCADLYDFSSDIESNMQGMWDRGGITAVNMADRKRYADLLTTLMSDDCQFLLEAYNYDQEKYAGPPHAISSDLVNKLYGEKCNITKVETENALQPRQRDVWGLDWFDAELYVITLKQPH